MCSPHRCSGKCADGGYLTVSKAQVQKLLNDILEFMEAIGMSEAQEAALKSILRSMFADWSSDLGRERRNEFEGP